MCICALSSLLLEFVVFTIFENNFLLLFEYYVLLLQFLINKQLLAKSICVCVCVCVLLKAI